MLFSAIVGSMAPKYFIYLSGYWFCSTCHVTPYKLLVKYFLYWQLSQENILETFAIVDLASKFVLAHESFVVLEKNVDTTSFAETIEQQTRKKKTKK